MSLTIQQVFDNALFGLRIQRVKSEKNSMCVYRGDSISGKPNMCGIGFSIPDKLYKPSFDSNEDSTINNLLRKNNPKLKELFSAVPTELLADLQDAHDSILLPSNSSLQLIEKSLIKFEFYMLEIANKWFLHFTEKPV